MMDFFFVLLVWTSFLSLIVGQEIGKVTIDGYGSNSVILSNSSDYYLSTNDGLNRYLHVSVSVQNEAGQNVPLRQRVSVTCEQETSGSGLSSFTFSVINFIVNGVTSSQVQINPVTPGRSVTVRCYGESEPPRTCPQTPTSTTQFCKSTSLSQPILLRLQPPPIVSFCESVVDVVTSGSGGFTIKLSDPVTEFPVTVTCSTVAPTTDPMVLTINPVNAPVGSTDVQMTYIVTQTGNDINVQCQGQSQGGNQYQTANSVGDSSTVRFTIGSGTISFLPVFTRIYSTSLEVFLMLDKAVASTGDVSGVCVAEMRETVQEAKILYNNPTCTPASTTVPSTNLTSSWTIEEPAFQFERGEYYKSIVSRREKDVIGDITEYVVVTCCTTSSGVTTYNPTSLSMMAEVILSADVCPNCTGGIISGNSADERSISNPAFLEIAPCPCDVTYHACDTQCCCDTECTEDMKKTFSSCLPGLAGGLSPPAPDRSCESRNPFKDDWFPLTCVVFEENGFLGLFYQNQPKITSELDFEQKVNSKKNLYTLSEDEKRFTDPNSALTGYKYGANIRMNRADVELADKGTLALPQRSSTGDCIRTAPVRFLQDFSSECSVTIQDSLCSISSVVSARVYAEPSTVFKPPCPQGFEICEGYGTDVRTPSYVNYYCADATYMQKYLKGTSFFDQIVDPQTTWLFNSTLQNEDCENACGNVNCLAYNNNRGETSVPLPPRCVFDDGFTRPPTPQSTGGSCQNSVVDVRYRFTWQGQKIIRLDADVIMGSLPLSGLQSVTQSFQVAFDQQYSGISNSTDNFGDLNAQYQRSGKPGYDIGKPVFSGCSNNTASGFNGVNMDITRQMAVFKPSVDGLCYNAKRQPLNFGEDILSSCSLRLGLNEIRNCDNLKSLVLNHLNTLMPANVLGRLGYNDPSNETYWVQILRQNISELLNGTGVSSNFTSPIDDLQGICQNVTTGIHLDVMYGETGKGNGYPIREILGGGISYTVGDWQLSCGGSNSRRCVTGSSFVETFLVTSSVRFIKVPAQKPIKPIQFWAVHSDPSCQTDTCQRYFENFDRSICHYDTCWHELFYPLSTSYTADSRNYALAFTLVFIIFILGYYMVGAKNKITHGISKDNSIGNIVNLFPTECCT